jgi:hypothetical protein
MLFSFLIMFREGVEAAFAVLREGLETVSTMPVQFFLSIVSSELCSRDFLAIAKPQLLVK